jgi:hypothetical protein
MRIPWVRSDGDTRPRAWWEWLFVPIIVVGYVLFMVAFVVFFLGLMVVSIPLLPVFSLLLYLEMKRLRRRLAQAGRVVEWSEVEAKLAAGEGTLILEYWSPKAGRRTWWTQDDLNAGAPVPLPSMDSETEEAQRLLLDEYANACEARYTNVKTGTARLTVVPSPLPRGIEPNKVVTLWVWTDPPFLVAGDAYSALPDGPKSP